MKHLYIVDIIGSHCGMHYYDNALSDLLKNKFKVKILSTYSLNNLNQGFFPNIFNHNKFILFILLFMCWIRFLIFRFTHKGIYIYLCYGELYDLPFLITAFMGNVYIDIHEVHALKYKDKSFVAKLLKFFIRTFTKQVVYHSSRTELILKEIDYKGRKIYVPHFKYNFKKNYNEINISSEIRHVYKSNHYKFLFFGNLSKVKGIDVVLDSFLKNNNLNNIELVIAGKNVENIDFKNIKQLNDHIKIVPRHINDDELVYLYSHTDYVLLPYRKSSQSGILAMATYFKKPMILSDIPYFKNIIEQYPSFGICGDLNIYQNLINQIIEIPYNKFYQLSDCEKYEQKTEFDKFISEIY